MFKRDRPSLIEGNYRSWTNLAAYRAEANRFQQGLTLLQKGKKAEGISLFSVMRNEVDLLPRFLEHYRRLGVARFVIVDNDSADGSRELLFRQPDVDLYHTAESYAAANGGTLWIDGLIYAQASGKWVLHVDADELLVYDQCDKYPLPALIKYLRTTRQSTLLAPLVDLYPHPERADKVYFDAAPETRRKTDRGSHIEGGPRYRMAALHGHQAYPCLTKYPLVRYGARTAYANTHFPYPGKANGHRILGRILHLKLTWQFRAKVDQALREGQHWNGGAEYHAYAEWLGGRELGDLRTRDSRRYTGPRDLIAAGLLQPIDWRTSAGLLAGASMLRRILTSATRRTPP